VTVTHPSTSSSVLPRRRHLAVALMTLVTQFAVMINTENLDLAADPDTTTSELTVDESAGPYGRLTSCIAYQNSLLYGSPSIDGVLSVAPCLSVCLSV